MRLINNMGKFCKYSNGRLACKVKGRILVFPHPTLSNLGGNYAVNDLNKAELLQAQFKAERQSAPCQKLPMTA